jgi:hypothetical protein
LGYADRLRGAVSVLDPVSYQLRDVAVLAALGAV